jgi:hypothetical protein
MVLILPGVSLFMVNGMKIKKIAWIGKKYAWLSGRLTNG